MENSNSSSNSNGNGNSNHNANEGFLSTFYTFFAQLLNVKLQSKDEFNLDLTESFDQMVKRKGYLLEDPVIETDDQHKLQLFRIINKHDKDDATKTKQSVLFQHGLLDSSDGWICNYKHYCLPFILCEQGFDVWVANSRGNKYSKFNEKESTLKDEKYWNYSFHEMGMSDLPANIEFILKANPACDKIIYIGHSQGGASFLAGMSEKFNYFSTRLKAAVLLAPASRVDHLDCTIIPMIKDWGIEDILKQKNMQEVLPYDADYVKMNIKFNNMYPSFQMAMLEMSSDGIALTNCPERVKVFMAHYPSGTSLKSILHFKQLLESGKFQMFDYGKDGNLEYYKTETPPEYDLSKIKNFPIILCGGLQDKLVNIVDIRWLKEQLEENNSLYSYYEFESMGHSSFLINSDILWFNYVLRDIYQLLNDNTKQKISQVTLTFDSPAPQMENVSHNEDTRSSPPPIEK